MADLEACFYASYPDADKKIYSALFEKLHAADTTEVVAADVLDKIIRRKRALQLSELAFQVGQGTKSQEDLDAFLSTQEQPKVVSSLPIDEVDNDLENLLHDKYQEQGLRWRLNCLNKSLGSLRKGDFGFIFARPETGKTTFLASECTGFLNGSEGAIVWLNNEEDGWKVMLRVYCAYFGVSSDTILSNVRKYKEQFLSEVGGRFRMFDNANISKRDVERIVDTLNPALVVYDQIDKIKGFQNDREDLRLGSIYQWARELAKGKHAAIGVCQADGHAEGQRYLTMEHVANAKTAKQAEADFILGIGRSHDPELAGSRFLNISKNKLIGDSDTVPDYRHARFEVLIHPTIARFEDAIKL